MAENSSLISSPAVAAQLTTTKLLVGEGKDEVQVFTALLKHLGIKDVQVEQTGGKDNLRIYLKTLRLRDGFADLTALGVIRDADNSASGALQSVCDSLRNNGFPNPVKSGEIVAGSPSVGVMVVGDGDKFKMLEDLCLESVSHDAVWPCLAEFFACLKDAECEPPNLSKARFSTWMAIQTDANARGLGGAAKHDYFLWDSEAFADLRNLLATLFTNPLTDKGEASDES